VATHEAQSYKDPGTPEEQSRRTFLANATLAVGNVIGLVLAVPLAASLIPESLINPSKAGGGIWSDLPKAGTSEGFGGLDDLVAKVDSPVHISFDFKYQDGYLPPAGEPKIVWGIRLSPEKAAKFKDKRPDLFANPSGKVGYDVPSKLNVGGQEMAFVLFSTLCPHLGCEPKWNTSNAPGRFFCPCHGSQFELEGNRVAGPAQRGMDPLPMRDASGVAQVEWITYKAQQPDRVIVSYT
jgi:menaquinol-cytochrome c reductase iron-sulfur subunit